MICLQTTSVKYLLMITLTLFAVVKNTSANASLPEIVVLTTHDLAPYGSYQEDGSFSGAAHDVVECALEAINISLNLKVLPWRRAQLEVKEGISDGFYAGSQNDKRDEYAIKSAEVAGQVWQWYLLKDSSWEIESMHFRKNALVSSFLGANMQKWLVDNHYHVSASPIDTKKLLDLLMLGRIDAALANNYVMDELIENRGISDRVRKIPLKNKPLYVYFNKRFVGEYPAFLTSFNGAVTGCR